MYPEDCVQVVVSRRTEFKKSIQTNQEKASNSKIWNVIKCL